MSDTSITTAQHMNNGTTQGKQPGNTGRSKAKRTLPMLLTTGSQERKTLKLQGSVSPNAIPVAESKFPLNTPFVTNPDSCELFIKLDKHSIISLFSQQKYTSAGVSGYLVNLS